MIRYRIYKQLIPAPLDTNDPHWAKRQVWVQKLNGQDTVDEFDTEEEAQEYANQLSDADPTNRVYEVRAIEVDTPINS
jgi:hypothetical protein